MHINFFSGDRAYTTLRDTRQGTELETVKADDPYFAAYSIKTYQQQEDHKGPEQSVGLKQREEERQLDAGVTLCHDEYTICAQTQPCRSACVSLRPIFFFFTCISLVERIYTENDLKYLRYDEQAVVDQIRHTDTCEINFHFQKSRYVNEPMGSKKFGQAGRNFFLRWISLA